MINSLVFHGREKEIGQLIDCYEARRNVLLTGPEGIGKTALLRYVRQQRPLLLCEETSSLRRICDELEREIGWNHYKLNLIERKNRLLAYLARRQQPVCFDSVASTPPRVARFIVYVSEEVPIWISARSAIASEIGALWQYLTGFTRIELPPFSTAETRTLIDAAAVAGHIQPDACARFGDLHRLSRGIPRRLENLLIELSNRKYDMNKPFGRHLLDLDRRIHELATDAEATTLPTTPGTKRVGQKDRDGNRRNSLLPSKNISV